MAYIYFIKYATRVGPPFGRYPVLPDYGAIHRNHLFMTKVAQSYCQKMEKIDKITTTHSSERQREIYSRVLAVVPLHLHE